MIRNRLGLRARFLMVATAVACWIPCVPAVAAGMPLPQAPSAPRELRATALDANTIYLQWLRPANEGGDPITEYRIKISSNRTTWIQHGITTATDLDYEHSHGGTTLYYHVTAFNGVEGPPSNEVTGTGTGTPGGPGAPLNLTARAAGPTSINLNWDAPLPPAGKTISGYQVNVSSNGGVNFSFLTNTSATETEYRHSGLPVGATRHYEVKALYSDGTLGLPAYANATTVATGIPGAPQNLRATAAGPTVIDVDWDAPASDGGNPITSYEVSVSADGGGSWGSPQTTVLTEYQHRNLAAGVTRHYRVRARNSSAVGPWTSVVNATTSTGTPPGPPRALTATAVGSSAIELSWTAPVDPGSSGIIGYRIEWSSTQTGGWSDLEANTGNTRTTYQDTGLSPNTTRYYRVSAINSFATGAPSSIEGATTELDVPNAPGRLTAQARGISAIELAWTAPPSRGAAPVTGYRIQWSSTGTGGWRNLVADTGLRTTRHTDTGLSPRTKRYYRVAALSGTRTSAWSNVAHATTDDLTVPGAPASLRATTPALALGGDTQIQLSWRRPSNDGGEPYHRLPHREAFPYHGLENPRVQHRQRRLHPVHLH